MYNFESSLLLIHLTFEHEVVFFFLIFGCVGSSLLCVGFFPGCGERGLLFVTVCGLLIAVASLVAEHRL